MCSKKFIEKRSKISSVPDVESTLWLLYAVVVGSVGEVSEVHVASIFRAAWAMSHLHIIFL
jgi:hypothetical protein